MSKTGLTADVSLAGHLVALPGEEWALWRWVCLRAAGFSASYPSLLAATESAALADAVIEMEEAAGEARTAALACVKGALTRSTNGHARLLTRAMRALEHEDRVPPLGAEAGEVENALHTLAAIQQRLDAARERYIEAFARESNRIADALCDLTTQPRFREAVLWQNRRVVHAGIDAFVRHHRAGGSRNSRQRQNEELIASYLQRYCLKNDTIGFFGPVGWATMSPEDTGVVVRPGADIIARRRVYFETWAIDAVAAAVSRDPRVEPWCRPRRTFYGHVVSAELDRATATAAGMTAADAALLRACDGELTVMQIVRHLTRANVPELADEADVLRRLHRMRDVKMIALELAIPLQVCPDEAFVEVLERIGDDALRRELMAPLRDLQRARQRVASAAGDAEALDRALDDLERRFTAATECEPTRSAGKTYAARTLVYEDCQRDIEVRLGREVIASIGPPLTLLLSSARWLTHDIAHRYQAAFEEIWRAKAEAAGPEAVTFASVLEGALPLLSAPPPFVSEAVAALHQRWARMLDLPGPPDVANGARAPEPWGVSYQSAALRERVLATFDAPGPGWPTACYHSPDVILAARSVEDVQRGDYEVVLGEMHLALNSIGCVVYAEQHPDPEELRRGIEWDVPTPRLEPVFPKFMWPAQSARLLPTFISSKDCRLTLSGDPTAAGNPVLPLDQLVIVRERDRLVIRTRDGRYQFDLLAVVGSTLTWNVAAAFHLLAPRAHAPRVTFDRLVVSRESWRCAPEAVDFARLSDEMSRFLAARRWARALGLPRHVFVKVAGEMKPFYVDFASPKYVDIFSRNVRRALHSGDPAPLTLSEMLPGPEHAWLPDRAGTRYTSEFRIVAVDLRGGRGWRS